MLTKVTYDPPVIIRVNKYYSDLYSSVILHWNRQLKPYLQGVQLIRSQSKTNKKFDFEAIKQLKASKNMGHFDNQSSFFKRWA